MLMRLIVSTYLLLLCRFRKYWLCIFFDKNLCGVVMGFLTFLFSVILLSKSSLSLDDIGCNASVTAIYDLTIGETRVINSSGRSIGTSPILSFETVSKSNITVILDEEHNGLPRNGDCNVGSDPSLHVINRREEDEIFMICSGMTPALINPVVGSNKVDVKLCNGHSNVSLKFTVIAKLCGFIYVRQEKRNYHVYSKKEEQWIVFQKVDNNLMMEINITNLVIAHSEHGRGGRGYLKVGKASDASDYIDICNDNGTYQNHLYFSTNQLMTNFTFKRAKFRIDVQLTVPRSIKPTVIGSIPIGDGQIGRNIVVTNTSGSNGVVDEHDEHHTNMLLYIGLALAVAVIIGLIVFAYSIIRHRKYRQAKEELRKRGQSTVVSTYSSGDSISQPSRDRDAHSINNAMYDRIVEGNEDNPSRVEIGIQQAIPLTREKADEEILDRRKLRLSQLDGKYIGVEIPGKIHVNIGPQHSEANQRNRSQLNPPEIFPNPRATFNSTRPPMPIPPMPGNNGRAANKYESIDSPLTEKDLVPPAYCSVDEETGGFVLPSLEEPSSSQTVLPVGQYSYPQKRNQNFMDAPPAVCNSSESFDENDDSETTKVKTASPNYAIVSSSRHFPKVGQDGYLSTIAAEKNDLKNSHYVVPNQLSDENLHKHFQKPVPRPGINLATTSMPTLLDDDKNSSLNGHPPKPARRKQLRSAGAKRVRDKSTLDSTNDENKMYKSPRPSAPDIFVKCAYQSTEDIGRTRHRLQMIASQNQNMSETDSEGRLSIPRAEVNLYDSPRSSPASSVTSLVAQQPMDFYATPRPSLPQINPDEIKRLIAENSTTPHFQD